MAAVFVPTGAVPATAGVAAPQGCAGELAEIGRVVDRRVGTTGRAAAFGAVVLAALLLVASPAVIGGDAAAVEQAVWTVAPGDSIWDVAVEVAPQDPSGAAAHILTMRDGAPLRVGEVLVLDELVPQALRR